MWRKQTVDVFEWEGTNVRVKTGLDCLDRLGFSFHHGHGCWDEVLPTISIEDAKDLIEALRAWVSGAP